MRRATIMGPPSANLHNAGHHQDDARLMQLVGGHLMIFFALR
jgi:hypothetical protein